MEIQHLLPTYVTPTVPEGPNIISIEIIIYTTIVESCTTIGNKTSLSPFSPSTIYIWPDLASVVRPHVSSQEVGALYLITSLIILSLFIN